MSLTFDSVKFKSTFMESSVLSVWLIPVPVNVLSRVTT